MCQSTALIAPPAATSRSAARRRCSLDLDRAGDVPRHLGERDRRPLALDDRDDLGALGERADRRRERRAGAAPGDDLVVDEADRVAAHEPPLRVVAGRGRDGAGARSPASASSSRCGVLRQRPVGSSSTSATRPACCEAQSRTTPRLSESSAARSAAMITFGVFGRTRTSGGADLVDAGEQLVGRGVERRAAVDDVRAEVLVELPHAARRRRPRRRRAAPGVAAAARVALGDLLAHVGDVEPARPSPCPSNSAIARSGLVGVDVDLQRRARRRRPAPSRRAPQPRHERAARRGPRR